MQDAKEILEFNKFMRKRLMEFYRLTKCPVPHSSMLFKRRKTFSINIISLSWITDLFPGRHHSPQIIECFFKSSLWIYRLHHTSCDWGIDGHWIEYSEYGKCSSNSISDWYHYSEFQTLKKCPDPTMKIPRNDDVHGPPIKVRLSH